MKNLKSVYSTLYTSFKLNKIPEPKTSTCVILNKALQRPKKSFEKLPPTPISLFHYNKIKKLALRRLKHEPIEYIARKYYFNGLRFNIDKPVVVPNPGAEETLNAALRLLPKSEQPVHFLDANCGCGIFSISLLKERPKAVGVALDTCGEALELTAKNFNKILGKTVGTENGLELIQKDFSKFAKETIHKFDLIIASPPCIPSEEWEKLEKETKLYESRKSIDGGKYGLDKIWEVLRTASDCLKKEGYLVIEMMEGQPEYLEKYFEENGGVAHNLKVYRGEEGPAMKGKYLVFKRHVVQAQKGQTKAAQPQLEEAL